jgi:hypothetical protein
VNTNEIARPDVILINRNKNLLMVKELKYNRTSSEALQQSLKYANITNNDHIKFFKYMGLNISTEKMVTIEIRSFQ